MAEDKVFADKVNRVDDFAFTDKVAAVFDNMLDRSVPFYSEIQRMAVELAKCFYQPGTAVYDLGCSTGTTLSRMADALNDDQARFIGFDTSKPMLDKAQEKISAAGISHQCQLLEEDITHARFETASVFCMLFTLQFVRPLHRDQLIRRIYSSLKDGGCLILAEKVLGNETTMNRVFIELYYDFKRRNNYSELEITQKREALENVLIPYRVDEDITLLKRNGFEFVEIFFKWYNFCGFVAVKHPVEGGPSESSAT